MAEVEPVPGLWLLVASELWVEVKLMARTELQAGATQMATRLVLMSMVSNQLEACSLLS